MHSGARVYPELPFARQHHRTTALFAFGDGALKAGIIQRLVLSVDR